MKKLQVAIAAASLFAVSGAAMALTISQSGVTIARETISKDPNSAQTLRGPTITVNFDNGPTANANSSQDFNVTLKLGGDGLPQWDAVNPTVDTIAAFRRNNGNSIVTLTDNAADLVAGPGLLFLGVDHVGTDTLRYRFRLVNPTASSISIGDLQLVFNGVNPGAGPAPWSPNFNPNATGQYALVTNLAPSVGNSPAFDPTNAEEPAGRTGSVVASGAAGDTACGEEQRRITVTARNWIGSGVGVEGESSGQQETQLRNNGYIVFATALDVEMGRGVAVNRTTDPTTNHTLLTFPAAGEFADRMALGYIKFSNVPSLDAWDTSVAGDFYKFRDNLANGDDFGVGSNDDGSVDVGNLRVAVTASNGFASGVEFRLTDNPNCDEAGNWIGTITTPTIVTAADGSATATFRFARVDLPAIFAGTGNGPTLLNTGFAGAFDPIYGGALATTNDRGYLCMVVPGGNTQVPLSNFTGQATLLKHDVLEQANFSCPNNLAGLGGGVKVDVRNFFPYDPNNPNNQWVGVIRVINNSETTPADLTGQYIRADGKYGKWGSLGTLPARGAVYFTNKEIFEKLTQNSTTAGAGITDNSGAGGITAGNSTDGTPEALPRNTRLRISSNSASTIRVQSYIYNAITQALVEVSAAQGADFLNIEASPRDHIDQDAQTGIKK